MTHLFAFWVTVIVVLMAAAQLGANIARRKNRSSLKWAIASALCPAAILVLLFLKPLEPEDLPF